MIEVVAVVVVVVIVVVVVVVVVVGVGVGVGIGVGVLVAGQRGREREKERERDGGRETGGCVWPVSDGFLTGFCLISDPSVGPLSFGKKAKAELSKCNSGDCQYNATIYLVIASDILPSSLRSPAPFCFRRIPLGVCIKLRRALDRYPQEYVRSGVHPFLLVEPLKVIGRSYL